MHQVHLIQGNLDKLSRERKQLQMEMFQSTRGIMDSKEAMTKAQLKLDAVEADMVPLKDWLRSNSFNLVTGFDHEKPFPGFDDIKLGERRDM